MNSLVSLPRDVVTLLAWTKAVDLPLDFFMMVTTIENHIVHRMQAIYSAANSSKMHSLDIDIVWAC